MKSVWSALCDRKRPYFWGQPLEILDCSVSFLSCAAAGCLNQNLRLTEPLIIRHSLLFFVYWAIILPPTNQNPQDNDTDTLTDGVTMLT